MSDTPIERPNTVVGAFYCWVGGAVLTAALGFLMIAQPVFLLKIVGLLLTLVGLFQGWFADRARKRDVRFGRSAVALATGTVAFLALVVLFLGPTMWIVLLIALAVVLLMVGSVLNQRTTSQAWYQAEGSA